MTGVIFTHSHVDHFGGIHGVVDTADVESRKVPVIAPEHFLEESVKENVYVGNAMSRRASYMYGNVLPADPTGQVGAGLGLPTSAGEVGIVEPNHIVTETGHTMTVDGVEIVFQMMPDAEAPSEFVFYFPQLKALCMSEIASRTLHNLYSLRGAKVRNGLLWAKHINESIRRFGDDVEVVFASHHWPTWGNEEVVSYLRSQRDLYRYIHDETLRFANHGHTMTEIAEMVVLSEALAQVFGNRGYYGSVNHDVKAQYNLYLGYFDGNPATLHPLPPAESAAHFVDYMGGADAVIAKAREDYEAGQYRWVAQVVNQVVFADPENQEAKDLQADALEQLGYQAESGPWRNFYLAGAHELRNGVTGGATPDTASADILAAMTSEMLFDFLAIQLKGPEAADVDLTFNVEFTTQGERWLVEVGNGVLNSTPDSAADDPDLTVRGDRVALINALVAGTPVGEAGLELKGNEDALAILAGLLDSYDFWFDIVTP